MVLARLAALDRRLPFGTGTLVCATAACVFVSGWTAAYAKRSDAESVAARPAPSTSSTPGKPDSPDDYLVDLAAVVPGYTRLGDRFAGAGPMGLEEAAVIEAGGSPTEEDRAALRDLGFVRGHSRAWRSDEGVFVVVVYEWKDREGPRKFVSGVSQVTRERGTDWASPLPSSTGVCMAEKGKADDTILAAVGKHSFLMVLTRDGPCRDHSVVTKLAEHVTEHAAKLGA